MVLAGGWSFSSWGVRGKRASDRNLLLMSASSKLPSPCSPVATVTGPKTYSKTSFFPLSAYGVVQLWCNFIMGHLCETKSISPCQSEGTKWDHDQVKYCYRHLGVRWLRKLGEFEYKCHTSSCSKPCSRLTMSLFVPLL